MFETIPSMTSAGIPDTGTGCRSLTRASRLTEVHIGFIKKLTRFDTMALFSQFQKVIFVILCAVLTELTGVMTSAEMTSSVTLSGKTAQYCDFETFEARCATRHEVVVMKAASYGRQETGRCLPPDSVIESLRDDPRYFGCSADVLHLADRKCSGLPRCDVAIPDSDFERITPCYKDSRKYLEANYDCAKVVEADRSCVVEVTTSAVHISSRQSVWTTTSSTGDGCGSVDQPWTLRAPTGQHIRLRLLDFTTRHHQQQQQQQQRHSDEEEEGRCGREYGYVTETPPMSARRQQTVICGDQRRDKLVTESNSNVIHVVFNRPSPTNVTDVNFLLRFYAVGCLDVRAPSDAWMRRIGSDIVEIGCYMSRQVWVLRCVDNQFVGVIGNCSQHLKMEEHSDENTVLQQQQGDNSLLNVLMLVAVSVAGLALCMSIICIGLLCLRRQSKKNECAGSISKYERVGHNGTLSQFQRSFNSNQPIGQAHLQQPQLSV